MSDDDRDIDIESDYEGEDSDSRHKHSNNQQYFSQAEKRAHHNALERKRRDHIKDSFSSLRDSVPSLQGEKVASRAQILKKAADYIQFMRRKNSSHQQDIEDLKRQNNIIEAQIRALETVSATGKFDSESCDASKDSLDNSNESDTNSSGSSEIADPTRRPKKMKVSQIHHQ
ncbi:protein max isoform X1 [Trichogramma pretiosum]|uniref:protein max isoform X1 n=1 Tax=Trichogramma pretiosum TaxID=7493 RepID=UPI0006C9ABF9|nr:protein max isoform X1 [Trichogramma pretiosum]XP_014235518.1 protein max isoform X1 [Trichogramma pretiosum]XP_014235593.1 protein max isoform X1 [Trichogramma pretiosum]XP_014235674.1 protein max isoform X1 [Trichogramma pretiosum]XP_014235751.1 protein max isoform X1 [Trichogramma pretiosum]XP_014235836.1 protein max isoform X1 [Trichogramma pretiosum]XP_014235924.1 protein max isoform X1 [Trichogramma pretiosum]